MLHFEGDKDFSIDPIALWAKLSDARFLAQCLPAAESVSRAEAGVLVCALRPGVSFIRGTLEVTLRVVEAVEGAAIRYQAQSKSIGSSSTVEAALAFAPTASGARVHYSADITHLGGLLKAVPQGLIKGTAQKVIDDLWASVAAKVGA